MKYLFIMLLLWLFPSRLNCLLRWSECRRHGAIAIPVDRYNPDTALNLLFSASLPVRQALSPCSPNFPKELSFEPSYQLSHSYPD